MLPFAIWNTLSYYQTPAHFEELVQREDLTVEQLLDEDCIVSEVRNSNHYLNAFFNKSQLKNLINMVIIEPTDALDRKRAFKFPLVACDVLSSESNFIINGFFPPVDNEDEYSEDAHTDNIENDEVQANGHAENGVSPPKSPMKIREARYEILNYLFSFLEPDSPINLTLAGYFNRILFSLNNKRGASLLEFVYSKPSTLQNLAKHIVSKSLSETLSRLLTFDSMAYHYDVFTDERIEVLEYLMKNKLNIAADPEEIANTAAIIGDIISKQKTMNGGSKIMAHLLKKETVEYLFSLIPKFSQSSGLASAVSNLIFQICNYYINFNTNKDLNSDNEEVVILGSEVEESPFFIEFVSNIRVISESLSQEPEISIRSTYGGSSPSLGVGRLKLVEVLALAVRLNHVRLNQEIRDCKILDILKSLFVTYAWNNLLHNVIEKIFCSILEGEDVVLKVALLEQSQLADFLVECASETLFTFPNENARKTKKGYIGQVIKMCNTLVELSRRDEKCRQAIDTDRWRDFEECFLNSANEVEKRELGGQNVKKFSDDSEREDNDGGFTFTNGYAYRQPSQGNHRGDSGENNDDNNNNEEDVNEDDDLNNRDDGKIEEDDDDDEERDGHEQYNIHNIDFSSTIHFRNKPDDEEPEPEDDNAIHEQFNNYPVREDDSSDSDANNSPQRLPEPENNTNEEHTFEFLDHQYWKAPVTGENGDHQKIFEDYNQEF